MTAAHQDDGGAQPEPEPDRIAWVIMGCIAGAAVCVVAGLAVWGWR